MAIRIPEVERKRRARGSQQKRLAARAKRAGTDSPPYAVPWSSSQPTSATNMPWTPLGGSAQSSVLPSTQMPTGAKKRGQPPVALAAVMGGGRRRMPNLAGRPSGAVVPQSSLGGQIDAAGPAGTEAVGPWQVKYDQMARAGVPYDQARSLMGVLQRNAGSQAYQSSREGQATLGVIASLQQPRSTGMPITETAKAANMASGALAQPAGFLGGLSPVERQSRSRAPWQPNVGGLAMSPAMQAGIDERELQATNNATLTSAIMGTPRATQSPGDPRSFQKFIDESVAWKQAVLSGEDPGERPAAFTDSENNQRDRGFFDDNRRGSDVTRGISQETIDEGKFRAAQEERKERKDIGQRMVTAKAQGRRLNAAQAIMERSGERKQRKIDAGEELTRDQRTPQQNANDDALRIAALTAIGNLGEAATPEMVEIIMSGVNVGGATGGQPKSYRRQWDTVAGDDPITKLTIEEFQQRAAFQGIPKEEIERMGLVVWGDEWRDRNDPGFVERMFGGVQGTPPGLGQPPGLGLTRSQPGRKGA